MKLDLDDNDKILIGENKEGFEFFLSKRVTKYAVDQGFENMKVVYVKKKDAKDYESILITENNVPIFEARTLDAIGAHIDILKLARDF